MSPVIITLLVLVGIGLLLAIWLMAIYNGLVVARNRFKNAFAQIDVQLKRRYDLIPNLVEAVKRATWRHEEETLDAVIKAHHQREWRPSRKSPPTLATRRPRGGTQSDRGIAGRHPGPCSSPCPRRTRTSRPTRTCSPCGRS